MHKIQDLFDPSKKLNRTIESVVTFGLKQNRILVRKLESMLLQINYIVTMKM